MKVFLVTYDNGHSYEQHDANTVGIFESREIATSIILSKGFTTTSDQDFFVRQHDDILGESIRHQDYAMIEEFEINNIYDEYECFSTHYKKENA